MTNSFREAGGNEERIGPQRLWLQYKCQGAEYLPPQYYSALLKPYLFDGCSDIEVFRRFLSSTQLKGDPRVLEIGPGTGRATEVLLRTVDPARLTLVDQSHRMLQFLQDSIQAKTGVDYVMSDAIQFCATTCERYDLVYSLWSISHAVHQLLFKSGVREGTSEAANALRRLLRTTLAPGGVLFFLHFDSTSSEQEIVLRQRSKAFTFLHPARRSPSQAIIEDLLEELARDEQVFVEKKRLRGSAIEYSSIEEALEIFMNFHMEGYFNDSPQLSSIVNELECDLKAYETADGRICIEPACLVYVCRKEPPLSPWPRSVASLV